jgi:hypothetical protein
MFKNIYGNYEFTEVSFGISNSLAVFMCPMNAMFREYLNKFVIVFLGDIIIYSKTG